MAAGARVLSVLSMEGDAYGVKGPARKRIVRRAMKADIRLKLLPIGMTGVASLFIFLSSYLNGAEGSIMSITWPYIAGLDIIYLLPAWILLCSLIAVAFGRTLSRAYGYSGYTGHPVNMRAEGR